MRKETIGPALENDRSSLFAFIAGLATGVLVDLAIRMWPESLRLW